MICLKPTSILNIPIETYEDDFLFIVNGEEFKTSRVIADLLSPVICKNHLIDKTANTFIINTQNSGDFSQILKLINFETQTFQTNEIPFYTEVIEILNNEYIDIKCSTTITIDNVFEQLKMHEMNKKFFSKNIADDIEFISKHFNELCENHKKDMLNISMDNLIAIFTNDDLLLKNEDQLLDLINYLYYCDNKYSILYETVFFENVSGEKVHEFIDIFNYDQISSEIWKRLSKRLEFEIKQSELKNNKNLYQSRYVLKSSNVNLNFESNKNEFDGIINHLRQISHGQLEKEVNITASSLSYNISPLSVTLYDQEKYFVTHDKPGSWIKFEFKNHKVKPTSYTIKSRENKIQSHPKSWVIEGSNDDANWTTLDEENNCPILNGARIVHTFEMNHQNSDEFRFIRMRNTGPTWKNNHFLSIRLFELHGELI